MNQVRMPKFSVDMGSARIAEWNRQENEPIEEGEILLGVETDKAIMEVEAPCSGVVLRIVQPVDAMVPFGEVIALIGAPGEQVTDADLGSSGPRAEEADVSSMAASVPSVQPAAEDTVGPAVPEGKASPSPRRLKISPLARKIAEQHDLDPSRIPGTGPGGRIVKKDILAALEQAPESAPLPEVESGDDGEELGTMRQAIGRRMLQSLQEAPQLTLTAELNVAELVQFRQGLLEKAESSDLPRITYTDLLVKAAAKVLKGLPRINARLDGTRLHINEKISIGIASATDRGLIVPVLHDADTKPLAEISREIATLAARAREGRATQAQLTGGTFTVSNLGMYGIDAFTPIINPPETAILGIGRIVEKPVAVDGRVCIQPTCVMSLTLDHRVIDGSDGAVFLMRLRELVEDPITILL
jgi:pyruvate dehydrogenase E2 component (dihydrolipoamide acetyltransferase)